VPAIRSDIAGEQGKRALAQEQDNEHHRGLPPYTTYIARTVLMHSLAFNDQLKGLTPEHLRYAVICPRLDISFIEAARQRFIGSSAFLDDRPGAPMRFLTEANLTQVIRREEANVDPGELRADLNDRIKQIFGGTSFEAVPFPGGPWDVPDEVGNGRPLLVVLSYDGCSVGASVDNVPDLISRIWSHKGSEGGSIRLLRNNLAFIAAEEGRVEEMRHKMARRLALRELKAPARLGELAEHQQAKVRELEGRSEAEVAIAIQQCFRHLFYPSPNRIAGADVALAHSALDIHSASERPGSGQQQVVRALRDYRKLRTQEDDPDSPAYTRDRTPLKRGQITTLALRDEFRRDPALPMLLGDDAFIKGIRRGVEQSEYVYRRGDLLFGPGDPNTSIAIDEQATVFTMAYAKEHGIWPRPQPQQSAGGGTASGAPHQDSRPGGTGYGPGFAHPQSDAPSPGTRGNENATQGGEQAAGPRTFSHEGLLREALMRVWEQARTARVESIGSLTIRMFDATDAFRLLNIVAAVRAADQKQVSFEGGYVTANASSLDIEFRGSLQDAQPLKEFLEPQLRAASEKTLQARFLLSFTSGLPVAGEAVDKVTEQLTKFATGSAYVEATAVEAVAEAAS
jgi:hypothetical protein